MTKKESGPTRDVFFWICLFCLCTTMFVFSSPARSDEFRHHEFREHDVLLLDRYELRTWRGGQWRHEWHNGRLGWWWFVGGVWYLYERPIYPYPLVISGTAFVEPVIVAPPAPVVVMPGGQPTVAAPAAPPQTPLWYYCDNPAGYYPYVPSCNTPFRPVPAKPQ